MMTCGVFEGCHWHYFIYSYDKWWKNWGTQAGANKKEKIKKKKINLWPYTTGGLTLW